jgi:DNA repair exonuclease SbcCD ATPase subunit
MKKPILAVAVAAAAALALSACGEETPEEHEAEACANLNQWLGAIDQLGRDLAHDATLEEVQASRETVRTERANLDASLEDVANDRLDDVDAAWDEFDAAIDDVPDDAALSDVATEVSDQLDGVKAATEGLDEDLGCG